MEGYEGREMGRKGNAMSVVKRGTECTRADPPRSKVIGFWDEHIIKHSNPTQTQLLSLRC